MNSPKTRDSPLPSASDPTGYFWMRVASHAAGNPKGLEMHRDQMVSWALTGKAGWLVHSWTRDADQPTADRYQTFLTSS